MSSPAEMYESVRDEVGKVLVGQETLVQGLTIASLTGGHVLLEGVPGIAKTTAAKLFSRAIGLEYSRVQMTPDLLPADITGTRIYRQETGEFETERGPVFANVVLADEINRATPKTQSALLEAMQEEQVTIDGEEMSLPSPFLVIATQNPIEMEGVFSLPEAQRDRFQLKVTVGTPGRDDERAMLDRFDENPTLGAERIRPVVDTRTLMECRVSTTCTSRRPSRSTPSTWSRRREPTRPPSTAPLRGRPSRSSTPGRGWRPSAAGVTSSPTT